MKKILLLGVLFTLCSNLFAIEVTLYGKGGITHNQNGTTTLCPDSATTKCATLKIESGEISPLINAETGDQIALNASGTVEVIMDDGSIVTYTFSSINNLNVSNASSGDYSGSGCVLTGNFN